MESSTDYAIDTEEIQSSNDLSTPDASTVADITSTENDPTSSETSLSLELADLEGSSSVADWSSPEVFTESALLSSASTDVEMMDVQTVSSKEFAALSSATSLAEELVISKLSSISMETSTEVNFSPSISNEVSPTFEPIPHSSLVDTSSTLLYNIVDLSTTNSPSQPDIITAETKIVDEENEFVSSTTNSLLEVSQTNLPTDEVVSSLISFAVDENDNVDTTRSVDMSEPTESVPVSTEEGGSYTAVKELYSSTIYTSLEQTPISLETNPPELTTESLTSVIIERTSSSEGYNNEVFTPSAGASSNEEFTVDELTPTDTGTSTDGSFLMADEFSGTSELPPNFVDTYPFSISAEFSTDHFNFLSGNSVSSGEDVQTAEEFQTSYLPILHEVTTSDTTLMDKEDVIFPSTTSLYVEDLQSNVPTEETLSSVFPFDMSGFFEETLDPLETNPSVLLTDSPASFQSLSTLNELSGDFTSFDPSLSTTSPPISDEVKPLGTDLTTSDEELTQVSTPTHNFENEGFEDNSFLTLDEDGSGTPGFLISTDQPHETVGVTISPINLFPSSLARLEDAFTSSFASTQISDTSQPSTISDISSTDVTFDSTSFPIAVSSESIADAITSLPATHRPTLEVSTSSVLPMDYDVMA
ncbi:mucin-3A-like [Daphnia magna]|uniref:mucin-3A-like n=1 Tax=Daphnia magna TaxID=35525 RepID=UPI001E1BCDDC|nr:mucin-3A-like [Daphnia magna]